MLFNPLSCIWRVALTAVALTVGSAAAETPGVATAKIESVDAIALTVADADRTAQFFCNVLDFAKVSDRRLSVEESRWILDGARAQVRVVSLRLGDERVELLEFSSPGRPMPADSRAQDRWFQHIAIITRDMDEAYSRLRANNVQHASTGPQTLPDWNTAAAGIRAFYFRDPDGHFLEVLQFPPGKGDARWHKPAEDDRLFLGIDHTAIVVAETDASVDFYVNQLGMHVAGTSENYGPEQERLNHVFGARLRITTLRAASGPGIELLEYLIPRDGRPMPADTRPNDAWHWHVQVTTDSSSVTNSGARLVRDPDGHAILLGGWELE